MSAQVSKMVSLKQARTWLMSVVHRYDLLMKTLSRPHEQEGHDIRVIEEHFLAISLKHSLEWLVEAERHNESIRVESKKFRRSIDAKLLIKVRNMREHEIEYFRGKSRPDNTTRTTVQGMPVELDPSSTIIFDNAYLLGGVDITPISKNAKILLGKIAQFEDKI